MRKGFLCAPSRAADAKARAQRALAQRRGEQSHDGQRDAGPGWEPGEGAPDGASTSSSSTTPGAMVFAPNAHHVYVFRERVRYSRDHVPPATLAWLAQSKPQWQEIIKEEVVWQADTLSDINLQMRCTFAHAYPDEAASLAARHKLYIIKHKAGCPDSQIVPAPIRLLQQRECDEPGCSRCCQQRGGYRFWWTSAKWTPILASAGVWAHCPAVQTPDQRRLACWHAVWPVGIAIGPSDPF